MFLLAGNLDIFTMKIMKKLQANEVLYFFFFSLLELIVCTCTFSEQLSRSPSFSRLFLPSSAAHVEVNCKSSIALNEQQVQLLLLFPFFALLETNWGEIEFKFVSPWEVNFFPSPFIAQYFTWLFIATTAAKNTPGGLIFSLLKMLKAFERIKNQVTRPLPVSLHYFQLSLSLRNFRKLNCIDFCRNKKSQAKIACNLD